MNISFGDRGLNIERQMFLNVRCFNAFSLPGKRSRRSHALKRLALSAAYTPALSRRSFRRESPPKKISEPLTALGLIAADIADAVAFHLWTMVRELSTYTRYPLLRASVDRAMSSGVKKYL